MTQTTAMPAADAKHLPVLLAEVLAALQPAAGDVVIDGTFGAGGYSRAILASGCQVLAIDRDPNTQADGAALEAQFAGRFKLHLGAFSKMQAISADHGITEVNGVVLDIGVSSMQIDEAARGFSFLRDGPLDMRMSQEGPSAADVIARCSADELADIIYLYGEEPRSRSIARAIVKARAEAPITTTLQLVKAIERATGPNHPGLKTHPATKTFQALRIHVNSELAELEEGLAAAEGLLTEGGRLAVVTFHSLEDRIVKRFLTERSGKAPGGSRHLPVAATKSAPSFELIGKGHVSASDQEILVNPRARSAKLRAARRTAAPPMVKPPLKGRA